MGGAGWHCFIAAGTSARRCRSDRPGGMGGVAADELAPLAPAPRRVGSRAAAYCRLADGWSMALSAHHTLGA